MNAERLNPWVSLWLKPRLTLTYLVRRRPETWVVMLAVFGGMAQMLGNSFAQVAEPMGWRMVVPKVILGGSIAGMFGLYLWAGLVGVVGRWLGGKGRDVHLRTVLGWSNLPLMLTAVFSLPSLLYIATMGVSYVLSLVCFGVSLLLGAWSLVIVVVGVSVVHQFTIRKAIGCVALAASLIFVPLVVIPMLFVLAG